MVSLLRAGKIGEWAFCVEEDGGISFEEAVLAELSRGSETYSVATTDGLDVFWYGVTASTSSPACTAGPNRSAPGGSGWNRCSPHTRERALGWRLWWLSYWTTSAYAVR